MGHGSPRAQLLPKLVGGDVFADVKEAWEMGMNRHRTITCEPGEREGGREEDDDYLQLLATSY